MRLRLPLLPFVWLLLLAGGLVSTAATAADAPTLIIRGAGIYDPETMTVKEGVELWLRDDRVLAWKHRGAEAPEGVEVMDGAGCTLVPGLFDLHVHVAFPGGRLRQSEVLEAEEHLASSLFCGVTSVLDLHHDASVVFALREQSRTRPDLARLFASGGAFTVPGGHGTQGGDAAANAVTADADLEQRWQALLARHPDAVKTIVERGGWGPFGERELPTLTRKQLAAITARARQAQVPVFTHIWSLADAEDAVAAGSNVLAHGVYLDAVTPDLARSLLDRGVAYVPTLAAVLGARRVAAGASPYERRLVEYALHPSLREAVTTRPGRHWISAYELGGGRAQHLGNLKQLADAGVLIGTGTDAGNPLVPHGPALIHELELYVEAGLTPARALRAATRDSARILGVDDRFGSLTPGCIADVVIVEGDPTADISAMWNVVHVFKAGVHVDRAARSRRNARRAAATVVHALSGESPVIADFDADDAAALTARWGGTWQVLSDASAPDGNSSARLAVGEGVLRVDGTVRAGSAWGGWAGVRVQWDPDRRVLVDARGYDGVRLRVRGTARPFQIGLCCAEPVPFVAAVNVSEEWQEIQVPFASLATGGGDTGRTFAPAEITGFEFAARNHPLGESVLGEFFVEFDWIRLYRDPPR